MRRGWIYSICWAVFFLTACSSEAPSTGLGVGAKLPELLLEEIYTEKKQALSEFRGRLLILNIWAPWCAPCLDEMPSLDYLSQQLDPDKYAVIGLTSDDQFLAQEFLQRNKIGFANYFDQDRSQVKTALGVESFPQTLIISKGGVLLERIIGWRDWREAEVVERLTRYSVQ